MRYVQPDGAPALRKHALRILAIMSDGESRLVASIHARTGVKKLQTTGRAVKDLVDANMLEQCGTATSGTRINAPIYRLTSKQDSPNPPTEVVTDNPFIWRTYRQWIPSTLASKEENHVS